MAAFDYSFLGGLDVSFTDMSLNGPIEWYWNFGDGSISGFQNPTHNFDNTGIYSVCMTATNEFGEDLSCESVDISVGIENTVTSGVEIFPNPAHDMVYINLPEQISNAQLTVYNIIGGIVPVQPIFENGKLTSINISGFQAGAYLLKFETGTATATSVLVVR